MLTIWIYTLITTATRAGVLVGILEAIEPTSLDLQIMFLDYNGAGIVFAPGRKE